MELLSLIIALIIQELCLQFLRMNCGSFGKSQQGCKKCVTVCPFLPVRKYTGSKYFIKFLIKFWPFYIYFFLYNWNRTYHLKFMLFLSFHRLPIVLKVLNLYQMVSLAFGHTNNPQRLQMPHYDCLLLKFLLPYGYFMFFICR